MKQLSLILLFIFAISHSQPSTENPCTSDNTQDTKTLVCKGDCVKKLANPSFVNKDYKMKKEDLRKACPSGTEWTGDKIKMNDATEVAWRKKNDNIKNECEWKIAKNHPGYRTYCRRTAKELQLKDGFD